MEELLKAPPIALALIGVLFLISLLSTVLKRKNGSAKEVIIARIAKDALTRQEEDADRRHAEMMLMLREIRDANREGFETVRERLHALATPLTAAIMALERRK